LAVSASAHRATGHRVPGQVGEGEGRVHPPLTGQQNERSSFSSNSFSGLLGSRRKEFPGELDRRPEGGIKDREYDSDVVGDLNARNVRTLGDVRDEAIAVELAW
jgi:hypothetical protein